MSKGVIKIQGGTLIALVAVLVLAYLYFYTPTFSGFTTVPGQPPIYTPPVQQGFINYNLGFTDQARNAVDGSTVSLTSAINNVFHSNGRRLSSLTTLYGEQGVATNGATSVNFPVYKTDGNYLLINIDTGTAEYPDPSDILASNAAFTGCKWVPVSAATVPELVCELDMAKLGSPNYNINPSLSTQLLVAAVPDDVALTLSAPADQTGIGTTAGTDVYVTWEITALASAQAFSFARIAITSNQTAFDYDALDITITASTGIVEQSNFANVGTTLTYSAAYSTAQTTSGITQLWKYFPRSSGDQAVDYSSTLLIARSSSDADSIRIKVHFKTYFTAANHGATAVMNLRLISANNAIQTAVTDSVELRG